MTWKEIKDKIEANGVKEEDTIDYIDIDCMHEIVCLQGEEFGWEIYDA